MIEYTFQGFQIEWKKRKIVFKKERWEETWRWRLTGVHSGEIPPFIIGTGSREIDIACLLDGWTGIFAFLLPRTRAPRL